MRESSLVFKQEHYGQAIHRVTLGRKKNEVVGGICSERKGKSKELNLLLDKQLGSVGVKEWDTVIREGNVRIGNLIPS